MRRVRPMRRDSQLVAHRSGGWHLGAHHPSCATARRIQLETERSSAAAQQPIGRQRLRSPDLDDASGTTKTRPATSPTMSQWAGGLAGQNSGSLDHMSPTVLSLPRVTAIDLQPS